MLSIGTYALCSFRVLEPSSCRVLRTSKAKQSESRNESSVVRIDRPLLGESASPFIGEGDGLTSERESVLMFF